MCQCDTHENVKEFVVTSPHIMPRPIISRIANVNPKHEHEPKMQTNPEMNAIATRHLQANKTSQNTSRHVT